MLPGVSQKCNCLQEKPGQKKVRKVNLFRTQPLFDASCTGKDLHSILLKTKVYFNTLGTDKLNAESNLNVD